MTKQISEPEPKIDGVVEAKPSRRSYALFLGILIALVLTFVFQVLSYLSRHGIPSGGLLALISDYCALFLFISVGCILIASTLLVLFGFSEMSKALLFGGCATLVLSVSINWDPAIDLVRFHFSRSKLEAVFNEARRTRSIARESPVALSWGESGLGGNSNQFYLLVQDLEVSESSVMNLEHMSLEYLSNGGLNKGRISVPGLGCTARARRLSKDYLIITEIC